MFGSLLLALSMTGSASAFQVDVGGPYVVDAAQTVILSASNTVRPTQCLLDDSPLEFRWDVGNDGSWDMLWSYSQSFALSTANIDGPATIQVHVEARCSVQRGALPQWFEGEVTFTVQVANAVPDISAASGPSTLEQGVQGTWTATVTDPETADVAGLEVTWDFGDGTLLTGTTVSYAPIAAGEREVKVVVVDKDGGEAAVVLPLEVLNLSPVVSSVTVPTEIEEGEWAGFQVEVTDVDDLDITWTIQPDGIELHGAYAGWVAEEPGVRTVELRVTDGIEVLEHAYPLEVLNVVPEIGGVDVGVVREGKPATLTAIASDPGDADLDIVWDLGALGTRTGISIQATWPDDGVYPIGITATDDQGATDVYAFDLAVNNRAPTVDSIHVPATAVEGVAFQVDASASDVAADVVSYRWEADGGTVSSPDHRVATVLFPDDGSLTVRLVVSDEDGGETTVEHAVAVANADPVLTPVDQPDSGNEGEVLTFSVAATDVAADMLSCTWDFGDGGTAEGAEVEHAYADDGTYTVSVVVSDDDAGSAEAEWEVVIDNLDPVVDVLDVPAEVDEGQVFQVSASASDPGSADVLTLSWRVDSGPWMTGPIQDLSFPDDDEVRVRLRVEDEDGGAVVEDRNVVVRNVIPTAVVTGDVDDSVSPTLSWQVDITDPGADTHTCSWDFDDGSPPVSGCSGATQTFTTNGDYVVTVTVTDDDGGVGIGVFPVEIRTLGPVVDDIVVVGDLEEGSEVALSCATIAGIGGPVVAWTWDFDDGTVLAGRDVTHTWVQDGEYSVRCSIEATDGQVAFGVETITVVNIAPELSGAPPAAREGEVWVFEPQVFDPGVEDALSWWTDLPVGAVQDPLTGVITWTPGWQDVGVREAHVGVEDETGDGDVIVWDLDVQAVDGDADGLSDGWEAAFGLDPTDASDAWSDGDGDGRTATDEYALGTDPTVWDGPDTPSLVWPFDEEIGTDVPTLVVGAATSPVGEPLTYTVRIYADAGLTSLVAEIDGLSAVAGLVEWTVDLSLDENAEYWWTALADDGWTTGAPAVPASFFVNVVDEPPGAPGLASPFDGASVDTFHVDLLLDPAVDPDRDALVYTVVLTDDAFVEIARGDTYEPDPGLMVGPLEDQRSYCWWAFATDEDGLEGPASGTSCFWVDKSNQTPSVPLILTPVSGGHVGNDVDVVVENGVDPEGRATVHVFEVDTDASFASADGRAVVVASTEDETTATFEGLNEDAWYHLRVACSDGASVSTWSTSTFFVSGRNDPPVAPTAFAPEDGASFGTDGELVVVNPVDPEGDAVSIVFAIDDEEGERIATSDPIPADASGRTSWSPGSLGVSGTLWWTARAVDAEGAEGPWSELRALAVDTTELPNGREPVDGSGDGDEPVGCACDGAGGVGGTLPGLLTALLLASRGAGRGPRSTRRRSA